MEQTLCCPRCGKAVQPAGASFCPYCGSPLAAASPMPDGARKLLEKAEHTADPVRRHAILLQAQEAYPDCLEVAEALLFLGRLYERNPKKPDYSVIKCYLWQMYLTPEAFSQAQKDAMRTELFEHPDLRRCQALAADGEAYLRRYLEKLGGEFVALFLKSSTHYTHSVFGFRLDRRMERVLAQPVADMLRAIRQDEALDAQRQECLRRALYRAFLNETGGDARWVDELLREKGEPIPDRF